MVFLSSFTEGNLPSLYNILSTYNSMNLLCFIEPLRCPRRCLERHLHSLSCRLSEAPVRLFRSSCEALQSSCEALLQAFTGQHYIFLKYIITALFVKFTFFKSVHNVIPKGRLLIWFSALF